MERAWTGCWYGNSTLTMIDLQSQQAVRRRADNMLPAINVIFLLLLFFVVAGSIHEGFSRDISPPISASTTGLQPVVEEFVLVPRAGLRWQGRPITVAEWIARLNRDGAPVPAAVRLRADAGEPAGHLVTVLDAFRQAGVARVALVTLGTGAAAGSGDR